VLLGSPLVAFDRSSCWGGFWVQLSLVPIWTNPKVPRPPVCTNICTLITTRICTAHTTLARLPLRHSSSTALLLLVNPAKETLCTTHSHSAFHRCLPNCGRHRCGSRGRNLGGSNGGRAPDRCSLCCRLLQRVAVEQQGLDQLAAQALDLLW